MNILSFINDIETIDIVILILVIFVVVFLIFLSNTLMKKNKELKKELEKINHDKTINDEIIVKQNVGSEKSEYIVEEIKKEEDINDILEALPEITETGPYKKNVLRELSARGQTSPVNIGKSTVDVPKTNVTSYVKKEKINDLENGKEEKNKKIDEVDNKTFIEEISRRMEEELKPQTIELTDYEKKQEEEAIISYQELIKSKDRIYKITDDEEIDTFIDELKEFRTNLEE